MSARGHGGRRIPGRSAFLRLVSTQGLLSVEGQVLAPTQVGPDQAKHSVVRTERIFDDVVPFVHRSRRPEVGGVGNGHQKNASSLKREMSARARRASAIRATEERIPGRPVAAFRDPVKVSVRSRNLKASETW